jgi:hypothetical protein
MHQQYRLAINYFSYERIETLFAQIHYETAVQTMLTFKLSIAFQVDLIGPQLALD